ncbi:MAG: DUF2252 domain-containing protein [Cytophagales bacterium]|nr:MAG: DUF2252 domain-containing protein [Cytophagales bacterium]
MNIFYRNPLVESLLILQNFSHPQRGYFFYFRTHCLRMQLRFSQLTDLKTTPAVFLHGNPHIENFAILAKGAGMVDFDRSRLGPYSWDIVRFLCSLALKRTKKDKNFLSDRVVQYFVEGYQKGFSAPELPHKPLSDLLKIKKVNWEMPMSEYLKKNIKWAKKLRQNPLPNNDEWANDVLNAYLKSRNEVSLLEHYQVQEIGQALGSLGNQRVLITLAPKDNENSQDHLLLDLKTVYQDPDNELFRSPVTHHGERMILASQLYAPELEENMGFFTYQNQQYWGRKVPTQAVKIKGNISDIRQTDIAYCVGTQLGRGHRLSLQNGYNPDDLLKHLKENLPNLLKIGQQMNEEILEAHQHYLKQASQQKNIVIPQIITRAKKNIRDNKGVKKK